MGAWGHESFANDSALDWFSALVHGGPALLADALDRVGSAVADEYLEVDESSAALAAAELVAAALGGGEDRLPQDTLAWLTEHVHAARAIGAERARRAVERVFRDSELRELWEENGDQTEWHAEVRELLRRLDAHEGARGHHGARGPQE